MPPRFMPGGAFSTLVIEGVPLKPRVGVSCFWRLLIFAGWPRRTPLSRAENPPIAFVCELKKQVRIGLVLLGEGQSAISDRAGAAHGISNPNATRIILRVMAMPRLTSAGANRLEASVQDLWTSLDLDTQQG